MMSNSEVYLRLFVVVLLGCRGVPSLGLVPVDASRGVPLHYKASLAVKSSPSSPEETLGRNTSEDSPSPDNAYYDYDALEEEGGDGNPSVTPPDVIYPNPDRLPPRRKMLPVDERSGGGRDGSGGDAQEIKSSNFVLRGISTGSGGGDSSNVQNGGRVLMRPNEVVDLKGMNEDSDHNLIDSIMYIYYGAKSGPALDKEIAGNIIVIGAVVALVAQLLTILSLFLRHYRNRHKSVLFPVLTALLIMTFCANFLFIVGVQSSRDVVKCEIVAMLLHYLHLSTTFWVFLYIYCVYEFIKNNSGPNLNVLLSLGIGLPAMYIVFNYMISTSNYEVSQYCWMSVKKGMIINYMVPISFFIVATAVYGTLCLRLLRIKQRQQFTDSIESFIEHSRSEQMLNQIRQIGPQCPQQAPANFTCPAAIPTSHRKLARCHSNPSSTTMKKSTGHLRSANLTTSSINLSCTPSSMSPTKEVPVTLPEVTAPCCAGMLNESHPNEMAAQMYHSPPLPTHPSHCLDMMGTSKSICGDSKYSLGSISLANLSIQSLSSETEDFEDYKSGVKFAIIFQIMFSICWFLAVIALEYPTSMMPIIYVIVLNIVNWVLLAKCHAICPVMIVSPLSATSGTEAHPNNHSFSKKSVKSNRSSGGDHHHHQHNQNNPSKETLTEKPAVVMANGGVKNGSVKANGFIPEKPTTIPFDDQSADAAAKKKKKDSVSSGMDTIPLLAKSAGLRAEMVNTPAALDNLDGEPPMTMTSVVGERPPPATPIGDVNLHRTELISTIST